MNELEVVRLELDIINIDSCLKRHTHRDKKLTEIRKSVCIHELPHKHVLP